MPDDIPSGAAILQRLLSLLGQDPPLLAALRSLAQEFLRRTDPTGPRTAEPAPATVPETVLAAPASAEPSDAVPAVPVPAPASLESQHVALPTAPGIEIPTAWFRRLVTAEPDLQLIEARCRLKAEGARWAGMRQESIRDGSDYYTEIEPRDREIISKAKALEDCFLWMNHSSAPIPGDLGLWENVAGCFEATAMAVALVRQGIESGEQYREAFEKALDLAAEAQSALRRSVESVDARPDSDQQKVYQWLRQVTAEQQVFIARYMRLDDPADPTQWNDLQERIGRLDSEIEDLRKREKQRVKVLKKGQYHARVIRGGKGTADDWKKVIEVVDTLVSEGTPPSNTDLRDMLAPIVDELPDSAGLPEGFRRVMSEVDRYLATQAPAAPEVLRETSEEVRKVATLYQGKTMVLIGGDRRPYAHEALKSAFGLKELVWIATREHESTDLFIPYVARADVDAVLLAIRWTSHSYGDVRNLCDKYGKEFYRLPAGYHPNQVAHQILQQRGEGAAGR